MNKVTLNPNGCDIKKLSEKDWALWKDIRLEALKLHPEAYGTSYEEELVCSDEYFMQNLINTDIFGAFSRNQLVGIAGFALNQHKKLKHKGILFTLYITEHYRGQGIANQLLETIIHHAQERVLQLHCGVNTTNQQAIQLYQKHGFQIFGTEPRALKVNGTFCDSHLMVLKFD